MNVIEVTQLKKYFGKVKAVDNISFSVEKAQIFGFLGPNGAGKTTTIRCLMDFIHPTAGQIRILGLDAQQNSVMLKSKIGFLPSDVNLYLNLTGQDHLDFVQQMRGKSKSLPSLIKRFAFDPKIKVKNLSTGNKQKLGVILAFLSDPEVLILDEPTRGLDPILQNEIYYLLKEFQARGTTIFFSSHNLPEVERICDVVAIIKEGKLVEVDQVENIKGHGVHEVSAFFRNKFKKSDFHLSNVEIKEELDNGLILRVKGDLNPLLKALNKQAVSDLSVTHATLEEIFMEFYKEKGLQQTQDKES